MPSPARSRAGRYAIFCAGPTPVAERDRQLAPRARLAVVVGYAAAIAVLWIVYGPGSARFARLKIAYALFRGHRPTRRIVLSRQAAQQPPAPAQQPPSTLRAPTPRGGSARRIRSLSRQQRPRLLRPRRARRSREEVDQRQEHRPLQDAQGRHAHPARSVLRTSRSIASCMDKAELKYTRDLNTVYIDFPQTLQGGPHLFDRLPLLRLAAGDRPLRCTGLQEGSDGRPLDQHRQRRRRIGGVVAEQGFVARRAGGHGHPGGDPERPGQRVKRAIHREDRSRRRLHQVALPRALSDQQLQRIAQHRPLRALRRADGRPDARLLRAARQPRKGEAAVRAAKGR